MSEPQEERTAGLPSGIGSTLKAIWQKMRNRDYREEFVAAHISNTISAQIHAMRQVRKWTQADLASRCEMKQPRISALEDQDFDNVEIATLRRIASAFDVGLSVRFVPYSEIARRATGLETKDFNIPEYSADGLPQHALLKQRDDLVRALAETKALLRRLNSAAEAMSIGVQVHNRLHPDAPARKDDIEGPVVSELWDAHCEARNWLARSTHTPGET